MLNYYKKNVSIRLAIAVLFLIAVIFYISRNIPVKAQEQIRFFPTTTTGDWQNPQLSLNQDLGADASLDKFNSQNSASPFIVSNDQQSRAPLALILKKIFNLFKFSSAQAQDQSTNIEPPPLPVVNDVPSDTNSALTPDTSLTNNDVNSAPTDQLNNAPILENTEVPSVTSTPENISSTPPEQTSSAPSSAKVLELSNFGLSGDIQQNVIKNVQLRLSMAGQGVANDQLTIEYYFQNSWQNLDTITLNKEISNAINGGYWLYALPLLKTQDDLANFKVRLTYNGSSSSKLFLDAAWLEVEYQENQGPTFELKAIKQDWRADETPVFEIIDNSQTPILQKDNNSKYINIFPTNTNGDWFDQQAALTQDLQNISDLNSFNNINSASISEGEQPITPKPIDNSNQPPTQSDNNSPLSFLWQKIKNLVPAKVSPVAAQDQNTNIEPPPLPVVNDVPSDINSAPTPDTSLTNNDVNSAPTDQLNNAPVLENTEAPSVTSTPENVSSTPPEQTTSAPSSAKVLELSNFGLSGDIQQNVIKNVQLRLSMAGQGLANDQLTIEYYFQNSWQNLDTITLNKEISNATNGGYWLYALPLLKNQDDLANFKVRLTYQGSSSSKLFLDAAWLEVEYQENQGPELGTDNIQKNWFTDKTPTAILDKNQQPQKDILQKALEGAQHLFEVQPQLQVNLVGPDRRTFSVLKENSFTTTTDLPAKINVVPTKDFRPGRHTIEVSFTKDGKTYNLEQNFTWGVLTINTDKSIYTTDDKTAYLQMAALSDDGHTICDAGLELTIENKEVNFKKVLSTEDRTIKNSDSCGINNVTDKPDYYAYLDLTAPGTYEMTLKNIGNGHEISDSFEVKEKELVPFEVERVAATRINPFFSSYVMTVDIKANQDFNGQIIESVPASFDIIKSEGVQIRTDNDKKYLTWTKNLAAGDKIELKYEYKAPPISPEIFLLGPLQFSNGQIIFEEARQWQIASDSLTASWTGGGVNTNWSTGANWSSGSAPQAGDDLVFPTGASNYSPINDLPKNTLFNSITISDNGYNISGNDIIIGAGAAGITDSNTSGANTIALNIYLAAVRNVTVTNAAETLTISGIIANTNAGVGGITKEGLGKLILSGTNCYTGAVTINRGVINAQNAYALGTITAGTTINIGAALELQGGITFAPEPITIYSDGVAGGGSLRNISGNNTWQGVITVNTTSAGATINSDLNTLTITGGIVTAAGLPLVMGGGGNITVANAPIGANTATLTKNGSGTLTLSFPNTYTGLTTVNAGTLIYGTNNAILSGGVTVNGGTFDLSSYSDNVGAVTITGGTINSSTGILTATSYTLQAGTVSAILQGDSGVTVTKNTTGTVYLTRPNLYAGTTTISAGILDIQDSNALGSINGATTISSGATLQVDGSGLSINEPISSLSGSGYSGVGALRNLANNNTWTGSIVLAAASTIDCDANTFTISTGGITGATFGLTITGSGNTFFTTAPIATTTGTLTKNGTGTLTLSSVNTYTGATTINQGTITINGSGSAVFSAFTINYNASLILDNSLTYVENRIGDQLALTMNGGTFNLIGGSTATIENAGVLTISSGDNNVDITPSSTTSTAMQFASLTKTAGAQVLFRGTNFGNTPGANVSTLYFSTTPTLTGGGGLAGTSTVSIIRGAFGSALNGSGTDMVTYNVGNTTGLRFLNSAGYGNEYLLNSFGTTNANVKLTASTTSTTATINSLLLASGGAITDAGTTKTITFNSAATNSGNVLALTGNTGIAGANTTLAFGTAEACIRTADNLTISAVISGSGTNTLTTGGMANLTLDAANSYTGITTVNDGTLFYDINNAISSSSNIVITGGTLNSSTYTGTIGTLTMTASTLSNTGAGLITLGGTVTSNASVLSSTISGNIDLGTATRTFTIAKGVVSTGYDMVVSGIISSAGGAYGIAKGGTGTLVLSGPNTYTGTTTINSSGGVLNIQNNTALGTGSVTVTVASGTALQLQNNITISSNLSLNLNGSGISTDGALRNISGINTWQGSVVMAGNSRINSDSGTLTISGNITGATYALTVGGANNTTISGAINTTSGTLTKDGAGALLLSGNNSYTGATTLSVGTIDIGAAGDGTNSPLGTTAAGTTVASGAVLDLNGYSLSTAEGLTINGTGISNSGAIMNSSSTDVSFPGLLTLGAASTITANYGNINLSSTGNITGATIALTLNGSATNCILASNVNTTSGTITKTGSGTWTLSGNSTFTGATTINAGTIKLGAAGDGTNGPLGTVGTGTTVNPGGVLNLNGFTLSTNEGLTLNGFGINYGGALINNSASGISFGGAIALGSATIITNSGAGKLTLSGATTGAYPYTINATTNIAINGNITTAGITVFKNGAGTLTLGAANGYTGLTTVNAGTLKYGIASALASGGLTVTGGTYDMASYSDTIGAVLLEGGTLTDSVGGSILTGTAYTLESGTVSVILAGAVVLTKNTAGTVTMTSANTVSSTTAVNAGTLTFSGNGTATSCTGFTIQLNATLTLDNSTTNSANRIGDAIVITMNGGNFNFIGNAASAASTETIGQLAFATGDNTVTVDPNIKGATLTVANNPGFNRTAGANVLFRGTSFGSAPGAGVSTLYFSTAPTLTGGGGAQNTTTISIIRGAFGSALGGTGTDMVTYNIGNANGLRFLNGAGFGGEYLVNGFGTTNANVQLTSPTTAANATINSVILASGGAITDAGAARTLTLTTANILALSGNAGIAGANTTLSFASTETCVRAPANLAVSALMSGSSGLLTTSGTGTLTLSVANTYNSTTTINNSTLLYGINSAISSSSNVVVTGGTLNLSTYTGTIGTLTVVGATVTNTGAGKLTLGGTVTNNATSVLTSTISGNVDLGAATRTFTINDGPAANDLIVSAVVSSGGGAYGIAKGAGGTLVLSGVNTYTGTTTINSSGGVINIQNNSALGTGSVTVTVASGTALQLYGGITINNTKTLSLAGTGISSDGALRSVLGSNTWQGPINMTAASQINSDSGLLTLSGNVGGATFGLTVAGVSDTTISGVIGTTSGTLTKSGVGTLLLSAANSYTGTTTISAGTVKLGAAGDGTNSPLGTTAAGTSVSSGAVLDLNGFTLSTAEGLTINGTGIASGGVITNSSSTDVSFPGLLVLGAASTITANNGNINLSAAGTITGATFGLTLNGQVTNCILASIVGTTSGTITKSGSGTWTLSGASTYTGATTINAGILKLGATGNATNTPLGTTGTGTTVNAGGVLDLNGYTLGTAEGLSLNGNGILNGGALINSSANAVGYSGAITLSTATTINDNTGAGLMTLSGAMTTAVPLTFDGGGNINVTGNITTAGITVFKNGAGTLTLSAANGYTGLTTINAGTLKEGIAGGAIGGGVTITGGTFDMASYSDTVGAVILMGGTITDSVGTGVLTGTSYVVESGTVSSVLAGAVTLTKNKGGTVNLNAANTYSSTTTVNAGTLTLGIANALTTGAVTVSGGILNIGNYSASVGTVTLSSNGTITGGSGVLTSSANFALQSGTVSAVLTGSSSVGLAVTTAGTVFVTSSNTFSGPSTIAATSILNIQNAGALGTGSVTITETSGGALQLQGNITITSAKTLSLAGTGTATDGGLRNISDSNTWQGPVTMTVASRINCNSGTLTISGATTGGYALTIGGASNTNVSGNITTAAITLTKDGAGTLTLQAANGYTGATTINYGTLAYGINNALSSADAVTVSPTTANATLDLSTYTGTIGTLTMTAGTVTNTGAGKLTLGGNVTGNASANSATISGSLDLGSATRTFTIAKGTVANGQDMIVSAVVSSGSGAYGIIKAGTGTLVLSNANTYTGTTTINSSGGVINIQNNSALGTGSVTVTVGATSALQLQGGITINNTKTLSLGSTGVSSDGGLRNISDSNTWQGPVTMTVASRINCDSGTLTISGATTGGYALTIGGASNTNISGNITTAGITLTKDGNGTLTLQTVNGYTGLTTVSAGVLAFGINNVLTGAITVSGGTLNLGNFNASVGTVTLSNNGTITGGSGVLTSSANFALQSGTVSGILSGSGKGLTVTTAGPVTVTSANTFTGPSTIAASSVLNIQNAGALGTGSTTTTVAATGALQLQNNIIVGINMALSLAGNGVSTDGALRNISGNNTWQGPVVMTADSRINSDSDTLTISGNITGATFDLTIGGANNTTISGAINTTSGTLTKDGNGTLTLTNSNGYTGLTTISAGVVNIQNATALGTTANGTTVTAGAALQIQGNITVGAEALTLNGSGISSDGALRNISGNNTWQGAITLNTTSMIGSDSNTLTLSGGITSGASVDFNKVGAGTVALTTTDNTIGGDFTISAGTLSAATSSDINVAGNWSNSGTFTASNTVTLNGIAQQTLSGTMTSGSAFYNLTITNNSGSSASDCGKTSFVPSVIFNTDATVSNNYTITTASVGVQYNDSSTYTINNINWNGQDKTTRIFFRDSASSGGTWYLNVSGTQTVSAVDVARSDASSGSLVTADSKSNDCGGNSHWNFITNSPPSITNVQLNGQVDINLTESTTTPISATATVSDPDTYVDITNVQAKIYRSGVTSGKDCTNNDNNCYQNTNCSLSGCSGNSCTATCTVNMQFFAEPTDTGTPWAGQYWKAYMTVTDSVNNTASAYNTDGSPNIISLVALSVDSSLNYGALNPGAITDPLTQVVNVTGTGNVSFDLNLYGTDLTSSPNTIAVGQEKYAFSPGTSYASSTALLVNPGFTVTTFNYPKPINASPSPQTTYWGIQVPTPQASGSYTGSINFSAIKNSLPWP